MKDEIKEEKKVCVSPNGVESVENTPESEQPSETETVISHIGENDTSTSLSAEDEQRPADENENSGTAVKADETAEKNHDADA